MTYHNPTCKCKTINLLKDNIGENLDDLGDGDAFFDITPKTQSIKEIFDKMDFIKIKNILQKTGSRKSEDKPHTGRNICKRHV